MLIINFEYKLYMYSIIVFTLSLSIVKGVLFIDLVSVSLPLSKQSVFLFLTVQFKVLLLNKLINQLGLVIEQSVTF